MAKFRLKLDAIEDLNPFRGETNMFGVQIAVDIAQPSICRAPFESLAVAQEKLRAKLFDGMAILRIDDLA